MRLQSFTFNWTPPKVNVSVPTTGQLHTVACPQTWAWVAAQCDHINITWSPLNQGGYVEFLPSVDKCSNLRSPDPVPPYYLHIYTSWGDFLVTHAVHVFMSFQNVNLPSYRGCGEFLSICKQLLLEYLTHCTNYLSSTRTGSSHFLRILRSAYSLFPELKNLRRLPQYQICMVRFMTIRRPTCIGLTIRLHSSIPRATRADVKTHIQ